MKTPGIAILTLLTVAVSANAQGPGKGKGRPLPLEGKELPDVTAVDENGDAFPLRQKLKGRHGVIVFGCLT